ncbi:MAG TPA: SHOCT domain-containing protein [Verrucomicrobiae bacterium]|nr:SHOCT domain-containing protein [Verrucomicrobiae bacterium]
MKKILVTSLLCAAAAVLPGCVLGLSFGGGPKNNSTNSTRSTTSSSNSQPSVGQQMVEPTLGQQLIDLQKAKDAGAITDAEYQAAKARLLGEKQP